MKKKIIIILFITLVVLTGCSKEENEKIKENNLKYNTNEGIIKEQKIGELKISNISLTYKENNSTLKATITNTSEESLYINEVYISIKDKDNNELVKLIGFIGKELESNKKEVIITSTSVNLSKAYSIEFTINNN